MQKGHIEILPSGSMRAVAYAGKDPMTGKQRLLRSEAVTTEAEAYKGLGALLEQAEEGRSPESRATVGHLLDQYMTVTELEHSTRATYEGYIRRVIKPALGDVQLRKLRGRYSIACMRSCERAGSCAA